MTGRPWIRRRVAASGCSSAFSRGTAALDGRLFLCVVMAEGGDDKEGDDKDDSFDLARVIDLLYHPIAVRTPNQRRTQIALIQVGSTGGSRLISGIGFYHGPACVDGSVCSGRVLCATGRSLCGRSSGSSTTRSPSSLK